MTYVPLDNDDVFKLARLAFAWDCTPQQALKRCLDDSVGAEFATGEDDVLHEIVDGQATEHRLGPFPR